MSSGRIVLPDARIEQGLNVLIDHGVSMDTQIHTHPCTAGPTNPDDNNMAGSIEDYMRINNPAYDSKINMEHRVVNIYGKGYRWYEYSRHAN